jgi:hypothetical protein
MPIPRPDLRRPPKLPSQMRPFDDLDGLAASRMPTAPNTDRPVGATQPVKAIETRSDKQEAERRRAYEQDQAAQAKAAGQDYDALGNPSDAKDARDKQMEAGLNAKGIGGYAKGIGGYAKGDDGMDELARARQAAAQEIDARNAQAAMDQRSRAGLGGLGLSGAASAAEGDLGRQQARTKILTMQEFDQAAEDAKFTDIQRQAALDDLEDAADTDYDGDGLVAGEPVGGTIGDGDLENNPAADTTAAEEKAGSATDMPVGATKKETEKYIKALPERGRGFSFLGEPDPLVSGPHKVLDGTFFVYRRQDNSQLYKSKETPASAGGRRSTVTPT